MADRHVLITGGGGGLGLDVTDAIVRDGATVTATTYGGDETALKARFGDAVGSSIRSTAADLRDPKVAARVVADLPRIDALVHLVGGFAMGPTDTFAFEEYQHLVALNLTTTFCIATPALARMKAQGSGRIVTISSRNALEPGPHTAVYGAVKAAVLAFTQSIAAETKDLDITANAVLPSVIDTPANRAAMGDAEAHRWVPPASLAKTIAFLASEDAGHLRGTAVKVYGGL